MKKITLTPFIFCFTTLAFLLFTLRLPAQQNGLPDQIEVGLGSLSSFGNCDGVYNRVQGTVPQNYECECWKRQDSKYSIGKAYGQWYAFEHSDCPPLTLNMPYKYTVLATKPGCDPTLMHGVWAIEVPVYETPQKLAVYYGYPSQVNGSQTIADAIDVFDDYDLVIFGGDLAKVSHPDHANTISIIQGLGTGTQVFGYVDLGVTNNTKNHSLQQIVDSVSVWKAMGVDGIFLDDAGTDYGVTRQRLNWALDHVHNIAGLPAFVNANNPDDVFSGDPPYVKMYPNDWYMIESFQIINGNYYNAADLAWLHGKYEKALQYSKKYGTRVATLTTSTTTNGHTTQKYNYAWWSTGAYGFDAMGWGEPNYSTGTSLPLRNSPQTNPGTFTTIDPVVSSNNVTITRVMTNGTININTTNHTAIFP